MKIEWNKVTWYSKVVAVILFVAVWCIGFYVGMQYEKTHTHARPFIVEHVYTHDVGTDNDSSDAEVSTSTPIATVSYSCDKGKTIQASYYPNSVHIILSDNRDMTLPQGMSGSGVRYVNADESFVFWNKGNTAFVEEGPANTTQIVTYANCLGK